MPTHPKPSAHHLALINWEGADWSQLHPLIDDGHMPNLAALIERGSMATLLAGNPLGDAPTWNTLITGQPAARHGIYTERMDDAETDQRGWVAGAARQVPALWEILEHRGLGSQIVGGIGNHGSRPSNAIRVSENFGLGTVTKTPELLRAAISDAELIDQLEPLWLHADQLGGEAVEFFVPDWREVDQQKDPRLAIIAEALAYASAQHAAFTWLLEHRPATFSSINYSLIQILAKAFRGLQPPKLPQVPEAEVARWGQVIARGYMLLDLMLGRIVELLGDQATVMVTSSYGYRPLSGRMPIPRDMYYLSGDQISRGPQGILVAAGPQIQADAMLHGPRLIDIAPTILHLMDQPVAEDMAGRVLHELMTEPRAEHKVASWQNLLDEAESAPPTYELPRAQADLSDCFTSWGWLDPKEVQKSRANEEIAIRWLSNKARALIADGQILAALPILEDLCERRPERMDFLNELIEAQIALGLFQEASDNAEILAEEQPRAAGGRLLQARIAMLTGDFDGALEILGKLSKVEGLQIWVQNQIGDVYLRLRRWQPALEAYQQSLQRQPMDPYALRGCARAALGLKRFDKVVEFCLASVRNDYANVESHQLLGLALSRLGKLVEARTSLEVALKLQPDDTRSHAYLARVKQRLRLPREEWQAHLRSAREIRAQQPSQDKIRNQARQREAQRAEALAAKRAAGGSSPWADLPPDMPTEPLELVLVTGLPGSGARPVFDLLAAGGMPVQRDDAETGDLPWGAIRELAKRPNLFAEAQGKLVLAPTNVLAHLPRLHHYKIVYVRRPLDQVVKVQGSSDQLAPAERQRLLQLHENGVLAALRAAFNMELMILDYPLLQQEAEPQIERLIEFLGEGAGLEKSRMLAAI